MINKLISIIAKVFKINKKHVKEFLKKVWDIIKKPDMMILPGQLAFFVIISIMPIVSIISWIGNLVGISVETITGLLRRIFTTVKFDVIIPNLFGEHLSLKYIIVVIITFIIASNGANSIIVASNQIYGIKQSNALKRRLKAIVITILMCLLAIFILIVPLLGKKIMLSFNYFNLKNIIDPLIAIIRGPITWVVIYMFIKSVYVLAPDKDVSSGKVNLGALFCTTLWLISTYFYSIWINNFNSYDMYYGSLSTLAILMLWIYLLCYIFVIGLCLNVKVEDEEEMKKKKMKNKQYEII